MARVFAITTAATNLRPGAQGQADVSFTVSNASGRALRGRADARSTSAAQQGWLSVIGEAERNFPASGTHQIVVRLTVPPGSPAGKGSFRLDMVSAQNPDDDFAEGPTITFEVPAPAVKAPFPWWMVIVAATVVVIIGGLAAYLMRSTPTRAPVTASAPVTPAVNDDSSSATARLTLNGKGGAVPDGNGGGATFDIVVSDARRVATRGNNVTVTLVDVNHGAVVDLAAKLEHVGYGPAIFIVDRVLDAATYICVVPLKGTYTFSSAQTKTIQSECRTTSTRPSVIPEGTYRTTQPDDVTNSDLSKAWNGKPAAGVWRLSIADMNVNTSANQFVMNTNWSWRLEIGVE
jgi:hypothetical protein